MKLTIDNYDGNGPVDYTSSIVKGEPFRILRRLNQPVICEVTLFPAAGLASPARNGRIVVLDDSGTMLFTGYVATEPAAELAGQGIEGAVYRLAVSAISDEFLLDRQSLPQLAPICGASSGQALQAMLAVLDLQSVTAALAQANLSVSEFQTSDGSSWSENAGELAAMVRSAYLLMNGTLTLTPVGNVTHALSESQGTLNLSGLTLSRVKALANDVTICGETEPSAYVTEYFQGDGTTVLFDLTEKPWMPAPSKAKPVSDNFQGPAINTQIWNVDDPGSALSLTSAGLTCGGGGSPIGTTVLSAISNLELGGGLVIEVGGVQFGQNTSGILNGFFGAGQTTAAACIAGFQISQANGATAIAPLVNGAVAGSSFNPVAGHLYTLRLRFYASDIQRLLQAYYAVGTDNGLELFGGTLLPAVASIVFEVQDTTNGIAGTPTVLYSGNFTTSPAPWCLFAPLNAGYLQCSIGNVTIEQQGPVWVTSTPPSGAPMVRRLGTTAQGADCAIERTGKLRFYPASTPQAGEVIAVSYRTSRRSVARLANAGSITAESNGGKLPGTACWMGSVLRPVPRSSADCENAASAILAVSTSRAAAWAGKYTEWNADEQGDVWPGDVLAVASASAGLTASLVVREVQIDLASASPNLTKYTIAFANDWADEIAIKTSATVPADAWLPQQPETATPLASLNALAVTSINGSQIQIAAGVTAPAGGGFEVRRRDWSFTPGPGPDLVLRSPVANFTVPRQAAMEQYYIRMYDGSTPPNYSRFSSAVFVNLPLAGS
ncbi:MAG TPA: hypothetical protein VL990_13455 [Acidobacteriaceae bacterium]|nr:hypothetical protein [Acidobacteriaceae bacterium]